MVNTIWGAFFLLAALGGCYETFILGNSAIVNTMVHSLFDMARTAFELSLGLAGIMTLWMGLFNIAQKAGIVAGMGRFLTPLFRHLMPGIPKNHPAIGSITMNMAANMLGIDNAATPMGIQAMKDMQALHPRQTTLSNAQILFLVINSSSIMILPVTILMYRMQLGATEPSAVFIPILLATTISTFTGVAAVSLIQRINLFHPVILAYMMGIGLLIGMLIYSLHGLSADHQMHRSALIANGTIFMTILLFISIAWKRGILVYDTFVEGGKEGFMTAVRLIPYLVAMLAAIGLLRTSGVMGLVIDMIQSLCHVAGWDDRFVPALPTAFMKPFSGSAARALMIEAMRNYGPDSFVSNLTAVIQGSSETTFYILTIYCGAVGIKQTRYAISCCLLSDVAGVIASIFICYWFFG